MSVLTFLGLLALALLRTVCFPHATIPFEFFIFNEKPNFPPLYWWLVDDMIGFLRSLWCVKLESLLDLSMLWHVFCANILQFLCRLEVFKLAQDFLLHTFSRCYHKSKTLNTVRIFPLRYLIHLIWLQENKTAVVSNRFIYLVWELKLLSFYQ